MDSLVNENAVNFLLGDVGARDLLLVWSLHPQAVPRGVVDDLAARTLDVRPDHVNRDFEELS